MRVNRAEEVRRGTAERALESGEARVVGARALKIGLPRGDIGIKRGQVPRVHERNIGTQRDGANGVGGVVFFLVENG